MGEIKYASTEFKQKMDPIYADVLKSSVGQAIIDEIKSTSKTLIIKPRGQDKIDAYGVCDAETKATNWQAGAPKGASNKSSALWYRGNVDDQTTFDKDERYDLVPDGFVGTGKGSNVELGFDPDGFVKSSCDKQGPASQLDEILLHEMVHALRYMQGRTNPIPTDDPFFDNEEEFLAIVVTNVYISEKNPAGPLRANHHGHDILLPPANTSKGFLAGTGNLKLLNIYRLIWTSTFMKLAMLTTPQFNPFRELQASLGPVRAYAVPKQYQTPMPPGTYSSLISNPGSGFNKSR